MSYSLFKPDVLQLLLTLYNGPDRHYHNLNHIHYCLSKCDEYFNEVDASAQVIAAVKYAIWFHDAIYSPYPQNIKNEAQSANLFNKLVSRQIDNFSHSSKLNNLVYPAIFHTGDHLKDLTKSFETYEKDETDTCKIMLDIDLVGFSKSFELVMEDGEKIFKEYACLGETRHTMLLNRKKFLQSLLDKPRIFYTDYFYKKYELAVRSNLIGCNTQIEYELKSGVKIDWTWTLSER